MIKTIFRLMKMKQNFLFTKLYVALAILCTGYLEAQTFKLTAGDAHFGALIDQNYIVNTWGDNHFGQLGDSTTNNRDYMSPVHKGEYNGSAYLGDNPANRIMSISIAEFHALALTETGEVYSWGYNSEGRLGNNTQTNKWLPTRVLMGGYSGTTFLGDNPLNKIVSVIAYGDASFALTQNGEVYGWGTNRGGQLGTNDTNMRLLPTRILKGSYPGTTFLGDNPADKIIQIAAGSNSAYALTQSGFVYAWGTNGNGELGDGTDTLRLTPVQVINGAYGGSMFIGDSVGNPVVKIFASENNAFALTSDHKLFAWGYNGYGTLGDNTFVDKNYPMRPLAGDFPGTYIGDSPSDFVVQVSGGRAHTLFLTLGGSVYATGWNVGGQLGNGSTSDRQLPVKVLAGVYSNALYLGELLTNPIVTIGTGYASSYAIDTKGAVYSWGGDDYPRPRFNILVTGALGDCNTAIMQVRPVRVKDSSCNEVLLPIELISFKAEAVDRNNIVVKWETASEMNTGYYELERKETANDEWQKIYSAKGAGTTSNQQYYQFKDYLLYETNTLEYRLIEVQLDGKQEVVGTCRIDLSNIKNLTNTIFQSLPNPATNITTLSYSITDDGFVKAQLFDLNGKVIKVLFEGYEKYGKHSQALDLSQVQAGVYNIRLNVNGLILSKIINVIK